jgi:hypothetical protein
VKLLETRVRLIFLLFVITVLSNCQKFDLNNHCDPQSDTFKNLIVLKAALGDDDFRCADPVELNRLLSFGFLGASNGLNKDYNATINGSVVSVSLPYALVMNIKKFGKYNICS